MLNIKEKEIEKYLQTKPFNNDKFIILGKIERRSGNFAEKLAQAMHFADKSNYNIFVKAYWHIIRPHVDPKYYK